jgi:sugar-specific transcriptional regulator TrmB
MAQSPEDALRKLEQRLDRASAAAERLVAEAAQTAAKAVPPPAGWQTPEPDADRASDRSERDLDAIVTLVRSLRDVIPTELQKRLAEALRELLQAVRALLDWYIERLDRQRAEPAEVQDIPIL